MVGALAGGVAYSRDPLDIRAGRVVINAVAGLPKAVVDGSFDPDVFVVERGEPMVLSRAEIAAKPRKYVCDPVEGIALVEVPEDEAQAPSLSEAQALEVAALARDLEEFYGLPQDMEFALAPDGGIVLLQSRPLHQTEAAQAATPAAPQNAPAEPDVLVSGGTTASPGVGCGPVCVVKKDADALSFPQGAVLVAEHSSPKYALILQRAQAVVTNAGSVTGHMASLAREYRVPSLLNTGKATDQLKEGQVVTVDAFSGRVYKGEVPELLRLRQDRADFMKDTPVYETLKRLAELVVPLNLTDPRSPDFAPAKCRTVHDVMRLIHELSYGEMFQISDLATDRGTFSVKLAAHLPLDLYIIDLGGGLAEDHGWGRRVRPEHVLSAPFKALLAGLLLPELRHAEPRPVDLRGFFSVMGEQMLSAPQAGGQRFGDKSYAIISDKYLNFSSRVGYHYSILDAYCGQTVNKNYVNFQFKGGAADDVRKNRRVRAIARILETHGFAVEVNGDRVVARFQKYEAAATAERLDMLGRLLIFTRQMDMLMVDEGSVQRVSQCFLDEDYHYENSGNPSCET